MQKREVIVLEKHDPRIRMMWNIEERGRHIYLLMSVTVWLNIRLKFRRTQFDSPRFECTREK
jgi:hypothetical protein